MAFVALLACHLPLWRVYKGQWTTSGVWTILMGAIDPGIPERPFIAPQESGKRGQGPIGSVALGYLFPWAWRWETGVQVRIYSLYLRVQALMSNS